MSSRLMHEQPEQLLPVLQLKSIRHILCFCIKRFSIGSMASVAIEKCDASSRSESWPCFSSNCLISLSIVFIRWDSWTDGRMRRCLSMSPSVHKSASHASTRRVLPLILSPAIRMPNMVTVASSHIAELSGCLAKVPSW